MENHIDPSTMLEFIEGLAAMAVLDQDGEIGRASCRERV